MSPSDALAIAKQTKRLHGWLSPEGAMLSAWIDDIQKQAGITGDLFEIGVHHGKSAALLRRMARPDREVFGVCDIFEDRRSNVSVSGQGNRRIFEQNMQKHLPKDLRLRVFAQPSDQLSAAHIGAQHRFFHIDAGRHLIVIAKT